jgi:hypothetical protein
MARMQTGQSAFLKTALPARDEILTAGRLSAHHISTQPIIK